MAYYIEKLIELRKYRERYGGLLKICQDVHMELNGSSNGMPDEVLKFHVEHLKASDTHWYVGDPYDDAVRSLVRATLREAGTHVGKGRI